MNTWVSFQSAEQPLLGQFSVSGNNVTNAATTSSAEHGSQNDYQQFNGLF
ncbi:hypothetical protein I4I80_23110 [Pseudomonas syringae pv. tomato]|nr:hypothetical protein [Pseudomonas syringae pv. tomato]